MLATAVASYWTHRVHFLLPFIFYKFVLDLANSFIMLNSSFTEWEDVIVKCEAHVTLLSSESLDWHYYHNGFRHICGLCPELDKSPQVFGQWLIVLLHTIHEVACCLLLGLESLNCNEYFPLDSVPQMGREAFC